MARSWLLIFSILLSSTTADLKGASFGLPEGAVVEWNLKPHEIAAAAERIIRAGDRRLCPGVQEIKSAADFGEFLIIYGIGPGRGASDALYLRVALGIDRLVHRLESSGRTTIEPFAADCPLLHTLFFPRVSPYYVQAGRIASQLFEQSLDHTESYSHYLALMEGLSRPKITLEDDSGLWRVLKTHDEQWGYERRFEAPIAEVALAIAGVSTERIANLDREYRGNPKVYADLIESVNASLWAFAAHTSEASLNLKNSAGAKRALALWKALTYELDRYPERWQGQRLTRSAQEDRRARWEGQLMRLARQTDGASFHKTVPMNCPEPVVEAANRSKFWPWSWKKRFRH